MTGELPINVSGSSEVNEEEGKGNMKRIKTIPDTFQFRLSELWN